VERREGAVGPGVIFRPFTAGGGALDSLAMVYDEEAYQYQTPPKSPIPAAILTSLITSVVVFFGLRVLEDRGVLPRGKTAGDAVEVPSLLGVRQEQARELLAGRGLLLTLAGEQEDSKFPTGTIASQTPLPGSQAPRGTSVQAVLSRGTGNVQLPNLVGLKQEDALRQLTNLGLQAGPPRSAPSTTVPAGAVAQTDPPAGSPVAAKGTVTLVLSAGAGGKPVPKITGMRLPRARKTLEDAGLALGKIKYAYDEDRGSGVILKQDPAEGAQAPQGAPIDVTVNED
jgi:eukaryotic-like serine/threonine-protein kinase